MSSCSTWRQEHPIKICLWHTVIHLRWQIFKERKPTVRNTHYKHSLFNPYNGIHPSCHLATGEKTIQSGLASVLTWATQAVKSQTGEWRVISTLKHLTETQKYAIMLGKMRKAFPTYCHLPVDFRMWITPSDWQRSLRLWMLNVLIWNALYPSVVHITYIYYIYMIDTTW